MDGSRSSFFGLAALPAVGATLLDPRPAFVFASDGSRVLFANAAATSALDAENLADLFARRFTDLNPLKAQLARLSRVLPTDHPRLEVLRFGGGVNSITLTAACQRLNLRGDERAVLAVAMAGSPSQSLRARAERLASVMASHDSEVAILDADGRVLATGDNDGRLLDAGEARDLAEAARASATGYVSDRWRQRGQRIDVDAVVFSADAQSLVLVAATSEASADHEPAPEMPAPAASPTAAPTEPPAPQTAPAVPVIPDILTSPPAEIAAPRFTFTLDRQGCFVSVGTELGSRVGAENGALAGHYWTELADAFGAEGDTITRALATGAGFSARLPWPAATSGGVEVELTAMPDAHTGGWHGFGLIRPYRKLPHVASLSLTTPPEVPAAISVDAAPLVSKPEADALAAALTEDVRPAAGVGEAPASTGAHEPAPRAHDQPPSATPPLTAEPAPAAEAATASPPPEPQRPAQPPSNVVRLPSADIARPPSEQLSGNERDAFRRIAEALGSRGIADLAALAPGPAPRETADQTRTAPQGENLDARLIDRLPVGIVVFRDGRTLFANRTLLDLLGYDSPGAFVAAGGADAVFPGSEGAAAGAAEGNVIAARADGTTIPVKAWLHAVPFAGATALMLALAAVDRDQSLVAALADSEARADELEAILDTATDGVIVIDRRGKMESMNRAAEALFGVDASQYFERYFTDLLADESQKAALDYLDGLVANGVASVLNDGREVIGRTPSGGLIPLFMTMGRIGTSEKFCAVLRDITHWKNVEEELVAARRAAETANTQKSDFLAKISHEIRTPLNAIIGFSEVMASERFGPIGNERYREYLRDIHVSGGHLMSLINDLLDLSKIEAGKVDLAFEAVPVNPAIQECVALMQPQANRERIIIRTALAADVPSVVADPRSLRQILLNLLSNAVKFTRPGGQVIVSSTLEANGEVVVKVRDTGIGMNEKDIETAMKPFRQVAGARDNRDQGTGLGLPLTKALIEANRAAFAIDSAPSQGTLIRITFPTTRVLAS